MDLISPYLYLLLISMQLSCNTMQQGCTDPLASNFDPSARVDDGSCIYNPIFVSPEWTIELSDRVSETSGLVIWSGGLWTINDDTDTRLYHVDTTTGDIAEFYLLEGVENRDWEDISQDEEYIYVGDVGNNFGDREDLHILRIEKLSLISENPFIDTIWFSFNDQLVQGSSVANQTEFDCEAFIVSADSIFLFTKNWITGFTSRYSLPKLPGDYIAQKRDSFDTMGQVTGATFLEKEKVLALCGYSGLSQPFLYVFHDYPGNDFFAGASMRIDISLPFHQVEGVATRDGLGYYMSSESYTYPFGGEMPPKLFFLDLSGLL